MKTNNFNFTKGTKLFHKITTINLFNITVKLLFNIIICTRPTIDWFLH